MHNALVSAHKKTTNVAMLAHIQNKALYVTHAAWIIRGRTWITKQPASLESEVGINGVTLQFACPAAQSQFAAPD
jgi:hypothetical protein